MAESKKMTIYEKLFAIQEEKLKFKKTAENPFYHSKYLPLDELLVTLAPLLSRFELLIVHNTYGNAVVTEVRNIGSSDYVKSEFPIQPNLDPQKVGSTISYAKRYNIGQLFNIITDEDDDANASVSDSKPPVARVAPKFDKQAIANTLPPKNANSGMGVSSEDYRKAGDLGACDLCGEDALLSKARNAYCPNWKTHKDKNEKYNIIATLKKEYPLAELEPVDLSEIPFK